jgi:NitT/TauT family transport system substrate-binding protein
VTEHRRSRRTHRTPGRERHGITFRLGPSARLRAAAAILLCLAACGGSPAASTTATPSAFAPPPTTGTLRIGVEGQAAVVNAPLTLGQQLGYFKDEGITPELTTFSGSQAAVDGLAAGKVDVVAGSVETVLRAQARGRAVEMIAVFTDYPGLVFEVGRKHQGQVRSIRDLVGHPVGVTALGSPAEEMVKYLQKQAGLATDSVPTVAAGAGAASVALLRNDSIWALVTVDPVAAQVEQSGDGRPIYDTRTPNLAAAVWPGAWPASGFLLTPDFARQNQRTTQSLARVAVRALKDMKAHPTPDLAADAKIFSPDGIMPSEGPSNVLDTLKAAEPGTDWSKVDLKKSYDNAYVKKVKQ